MDWIHCNLCSNQPKNSSPGYVLTSCGHIFCEKCENRENIDQCKVCKSPCAVTKLTASMKPEVRAYFEDTEEIVKRLLQTIRFQKSHRFSLYKAYKKTGEKYQAAKNHIRKIEAQNSSMKRKLDQYEKSKISSSPRAEFHFTPDTNRRNSPVFSSVSSQNSAQPGQPNFSFRVPDLRAYQQYRNVMQKTPTTSPAESALTPRNNSSNVHQRKNQPTPKVQSRFPMRTPPYNDFQGMKITGQKYK